MYGKSIIYGLCLLFYLGLSNAQTPRESLAQKKVDIGEYRFTLEVADTAEKRATGLMWRDELPIDRGMLFVYPNEGNYRIWMKNTRIPLQVLWIDSDLRIQAIKTLLPCESAACFSFGIDEKSRYIMEINADVPGIKPGMQVTWVE